MNRISLNPGATINGTRAYVIDAVIGNGATCIVYDAHYVDNHNYSHNVRLKECFPFGIEIERKEDNLVWENADDKANNLKTFANSYHKLMANQNGNFTVSAYDIFEANNTMYIVMDANEGETFDKCNLSIKEILNSVKLLTHVIGEYHKHGYLHLDVKPENFLVYPRPSEHIVLFDLDSVTSIEDIKSGKVQCVPYSKNWAAPEQIQGAINKLCPATDIFSIGATLFEKIIGRKVTNSDTGIFAEWDFDDNELLDKINPKIKRLLSEVFHRTLSANIKRRYQCTDELLSALTDMIATVEQKQYLISDYIISDINFVGRNDDLNKMHSLLSNGTKAVFLHGFGGVGKTELARKYAEIYGKHYDCVKFERYSNELKKIIDGIEIANADTIDKTEHLKTLKSVLKDSKTLLIIDNFDVEDDEYLSTVLELNCNIIFTTRNDYSQYISSEKIEVIELESLPTDALLQIFKNEYGKEISDDEKSLIEDVIEKFGNLTIIIPMIAKQIISSHISIEEFASSIENDTFARFDEENEDIRIRKDGQSRKTNSLDYLRAMFNIADLSEECITALRYLYLLRYYNKTELSISDYRKYTNSKKVNALNDLAFRNWITIKYDEYEQDDMISVHQLIYDLVEKDFYPTYDTVPGISKHIEDCFAIIEDLMNPDDTVSDTEIDWEAVKPITFALLMYDDIRRSDSKESHSRKMSVLYAFMCIAFLNDSQKTYKLFFESPDESTYYFYVSGIMDWFDFAGKYFEEIHKLENWSISLENDGLSFEFSDGTKVEFDTDKEKNEFIEYVANAQKKACDDLLTYAVTQIPYFVMSYYFFSMDNQMNMAQKNINFLRLTEEQLSHPGTVNIEYGNMSASDFAVYRLEWYLTICSKPRYNKDAERQMSGGINNTVNYEFYFLTYELLKQALRLDIDDELRKKYNEKAEEIFMLFEEVNDKFAWYGLTEQEILEYTPASLEEYNVNKALHWSKKANKWYDSVENMLINTDSPYAIYKLLLTFDYHNNVLNNSKITKLISSNLVNRIYEDNRLTDEQKEEVLIGHVIKQTHSCRIGKRKLNNFTKKHLPTLQLYFECLSKVINYIPDINNHILTGKIVVFLNSAYTLRRFLKKEIFDYCSYVEECITLDNIDYIAELLYFADQVRKTGYIKKSQHLKQKIMDLCLNANVSDLKEETIQMMLYKVRPLAVNYSREDVISKLDTLPNSVERKYYLRLLDSVHFTFGTKEQTSIACKFLDDYIQAVVTEAYNKRHNNLYIEELDEMEKLLEQYDYWLILYANTRSSWYASIFGNRALGEGIPKGAIRQISPIELSQYMYASYNPTMDIGVCYLLAEAYDDIYSESMFNCPLEAVVENDGSEKDYTLSSEEIQEVIENIISICPKAKQDVDNYFKTIYTI